MKQAYELPNYVLTNSNRMRVANLLESIGRKLMAEGVTYNTYSTQRAQNALKDCVCGPMLQRLHLEYEHEVIGYFID